MLHGETAKLLGHFLWIPPSNWPQFYDIIAAYGGDAVYKNCKTDLSAQRQKHIALCFLEMVKETSFEEISITQLCQRAGVPRNSFYRYFANKEAILKYLLEYSLHQMLEKVVQTYHASKEREILFHLTNWLHLYKEQEQVWELFDTQPHPAHPCEADV